jgi:hypothetical protein
MAGATAGRRSSSSVWPCEDLAKAGGSHTRSVCGCMCVLESTDTRGRAANARARSAPRREDGSPSVRSGWPRPAELHAGYHVNRLENSTVSGRLHT